jgi:hypothetical protein
MVYGVGHQLLTYPIRKLHLHKRIRESQQFGVALLGYSILEMESGGGVYPVPIM